MWDKNGYGHEEGREREKEREVEGRKCVLNKLILQIHLWGPINKKSQDKYYV